jgi:hypothetical protein
MKIKNNPLKSQNLKYIVSYVGLNLVIFYIITVGISDIGKITDPELWKLKETTIKLITSITGLGFGILAVILNGLVSGDFKARLVFWRLHNPLPGCRAFSYYMNIDPRVDVNILQTRFGQFPSEPAQQNSLWYRIYRKNESHPSILDAHAGFLLSRDLATLNIVFIFTLGPTALYFAENTKLAIYYTVALAVLYGLISQAARTYGERFVTNALAVESSTS